VRLFGDALERDARQVTVGVLRRVQRLDEAGAGAQPAMTGSKSFMSISARSPPAVPHDA
jgi:hypothetical protein